MTQVKLIEAAKAVIARWDTPRWKDAKHTADYIYSLRDAVNAAELASQAQPTPSQSDERVEFESEIKKYTVCSQSTFKLSGYTDKKVAFYDNQYTQYAWFGWQARANLSKPQADQADTIAHLQLENAKLHEALHRAIECTDDFDMIDRLNGKQYFKHEIFKHELELLGETK